MNKNLDLYSDLMTWLNGRSVSFSVMHKGKRVSLWSPKDEITIEDAILQFCEREKIDIKEEIEI